VSTLSASQILLLYSWFLLVTLLAFLLLIARFYQKFSGKRTFFQLFLLPIALFGIAAVRYAGVQRVADDAPADLLSAAGGLILVYLCLRLYRLMIAGKDK
jgi:type II secretory pathway component PulF